MNILLFFSFSFSACSRLDRGNLVDTPFSKARHCVLISGNQHLALHQHESEERTILNFSLSLPGNQTYNACAPAPRLAFCIFKEKKVKF